MGSNQIIKRKTVSADVLGGKHANKILGEVWCHLSGLNSPNYQEPNLRETVSGEEERGNLACVGTAWVQLGEGSCPQREIETGYFWACPPCPLAHIQSCIIHTLHYLRSSISGATAGPSCTVPIKTFEFMVSCLTLTDGRCEVGGSLRLSHHREGSRRKWLHRLLSLDFSSVRLCCSMSEIRLPQDERWGRELCVMALVCYISPNCSWYNNEGR